MDLTEERDYIFSEIGEPANYTPKGGTASPATAIYAAPVDSTRLFGEEVADERPSAFCKDEEIPGVTNNATLAVGGISYYVSEIRRVDKWKITRLFLSKHPV